MAKDYSDWSTYGGQDILRLQAGFDLNQIRDYCMARYNPEKGTLSVLCFIETKGRWLDEARLQKRIFAAVPFPTQRRLCVVENRTRHVRGVGRQTFVSIELYALCDRPTADTVQATGNLFENIVEDECNN